MLALSALRMVEIVVTGTPGGTRRRAIGNTGGFGGNPRGGTDVDGLLVMVNGAPAQDDETPIEVLETIVGGDRVHIRVLTLPAAVPNDRAGSRSAIDARDRDTPTGCLGGPRDELLPRYPVGFFIGRGEGLRKRRFLNTEALEIQQQRG